MNCLALVPKMLVKWKRISCEQSTRWKHLSQLKASAFISLQKIVCEEMQQLYTCDK
jgi:hypothetical protein